MEQQIAYALVVAIVLEIALGFSGMGFVYKLDDDEELMNWAQKRFGKWPIHLAVNIVMLSGLFYYQVWEFLNVESTPQTIINWLVFGFVIHRYVHESSRCVAMAREGIAFVQKEIKDLTASLDSQYPERRNAIPLVWFMGFFFLGLHLGAKIYIFLFAYGSFKAAL